MVGSVWRITVGFYTSPSPAVFASSTSPTTYVIVSGKHEKTYYTYYWKHTSNNKTSWCVLSITHVIHPSPHVTHEITLSIVNPAVAIGITLRVKFRFAAAWAEHSSLTSSNDTEDRNAFKAPPFRRYNHVLADCSNYVPAETTTEVLLNTSLSHCSDWITSYSTHAVFYAWVLHNL